MSGGYSLRRRLSLGLAGAVTAIWLLGVVVAGLVMRHELDEAFDSALQETAQRLLPLAVTEIINHGGDLSAAREIAPLGPHDEFLTYLIRDKLGNVILRSHDARITDFPALPRPGFTDTASHRVFGETAISGNIFVEVAEPLDHRREATLESTVSLAIPLILFVPLIAVGVWWAVSRSVAPVLGLRDEIETRGAGDLTPVAGGGLPDEVGPIAEAVNRLLSRLQRSLEAERSFTANSAHELRTPIAGALAQTQRLMATLPAGDVLDRARKIETTLRRLTRISEKLMQLARAEGGGLLAPGAADLMPVLMHVVEAFRGDGAADGRLELEAADGASLVSILDVDAFGILLRNLIENALKHSPDGTPVLIAVDAPDTVRVVNDGPAVPAEILRGLTEPFARGGSVAEGSGLGLAIADAIARGAGGELTLRSPTPGRDDGFEAEVRLP